MAEFDLPDELPKNTPDNDWDLDWDEFWDQASELTGSNQNNNHLKAVLKPTSNKKFTNELEKALDDNLENDFGPNLDWGVIDDTKPTNLNSRLKSFLIAPFSAVLEPKLEAPPSLEPPISTKEKPESKSLNKKDRPTIQIKPPKIHSTIGESSKRKDNIIREASDLSFNNLNNVSRSELSEINDLLEGSLGKKDSVKFDKDIVQEKNINFVAQEKILRKMKVEPEKKLKDKFDIESLSAEQTIASEARPGDTLVPGLNDIRFDLKSAQETSHLFDQNEINEILIRMPAEKARSRKERNIASSDKVKDNIEQNKIADALFDTNEKANQEENYKTADNLLDSLLDEIDGEVGDVNMDDSDFSESKVESLGKDEVITQENIIDDNSEAALEFMDSAASEAESLFEDFFKQGTSDKEKVVETKVSYSDVLKAKVKESKALLLLCLRFIKEPKYFLTYFNITLKDVFVAIGIIFMLIAYTGLIHIQFITEKFPMNLF